MSKFTGTWENISSSHFDRDYLHRECPPYVRLRQRDDRIDGEYQLGPRRGHIDGRPDGQDRIIFSFEGMDEEELVNGCGTAVLEQERLVLSLMYHFGGDFTFTGEKLTSPSPRENRADDG